MERRAHKLLEISEVEGDEKTPDSASKIRGNKRRHHAGIRVTSLWGRIRCTFRGTFCTDMFSCVRVCRRALSPARNLSFETCIPSIRKNVSRKPTITERILMTLHLLWDWSEQRRTRLEQTKHHPLHFTISTPRSTPVRYSALLGVLQPIIDLHARVDFLGTKYFKLIMCSKVGPIFLGIMWTINKTNLKNCPCNASGNGQSNLRRFQVAHVLPTVHSGCPKTDIDTPPVPAEAV